MTPPLGRMPVTADQPPRNLNDPVCCRHSGLIRTLRPAMSSRNGELSRGVWRTCPASRSAAARIISMFMRWPVPLEISTQHQGFRVHRGRGHDPGRPWPRSYPRPRQRSRRRPRNSPVTVGDQPPRNLNDPVCCRHSGLIRTLRPAMSSRPFVIEERRVEQRRMADVPRKPVGGGPDHFDVHAMALRNFDTTIKAIIRAARLKKSGSAGLLHLGTRDGRGAEQVRIRPPVANRGRDHIRAARLHLGKGRGAEQVDRPQQSPGRAAVRPRRRPWAQVDFQPVHGVENRHTSGAG